jgi:hypothetical protein
MEGFERDQGTTDFGRKYAVAQNTGSWNFITGPKVGQAMQAGSNLDAELRTKALVGAVQNTWVVGWRVRGATSSGTIAAGDRAGGVTLFSGSSDQIEVRYHSLGGGGVTWRVYRGSTLLGESPSFWDVDWTYWEFKITARTATNGAVQIRRDGAVFYTLSGINAGNSGGDGADRVRFLFQMGNNGSFDDIYILDTSGALNNDYLSGDVVVFGSSPSADGNRNQWSPSRAGTHFDLVNDAAGAPTDATKVKSQTPGQDELYDYQNLNLVSSGQPIYGMQLSTTGGMETSGNRTLKPLVRDTGGSEANGPSWNWSDTSQHNEPTIFEQNPVTSVAWSKASLDAAQFGLDLFA